MPESTSTIDSPQSFERPSSVRYEVMGFLSASAVIAYVTRNAIGVAESTIREDLGLTLEQSGLFMGAFFWSYALLQIPGGLVARMRGPKFSMVLFMGVGAVATLNVGLAGALWLLIAAQLFMGVAQAGLFPSAVLTISRWSPLAKRSLACGMLAMGMQVGAVLSSLLTGELITFFEATDQWSMSWRWVFYLYAIPGVIWALLFYLRFENYPRQHSKVNPAELELIELGKTEEIEHEQAPTPWPEILGSPSIWFLCAQQACRAAGYSFFASWFPTFLQETRGVSVKESGYLQAFVFCGTLLGCLIGGWVTDWVLRKTGNLRRSRSLVGGTSLIGCSLLILGAWFVESTTVAVGLLAVGALFSAQVGPCAYSATIDIGGKHVSQVFGLMNMIGNLAAASSPIIVARFFNIVPNWTYVLLGFAVVHLVGAISWFFVDANRKVTG